MPIPSVMKTLEMCVLVSVLFSTTWAGPCTGPECLEDMMLYETDSDNILYKLLVFLSRVFSDGEKGGYRRDVVHRLYTDRLPNEPEQIPEKKWRPYSRFVRIGRSSGSEFASQAEKRNYVRIGKIPSSAFIRFRGGAASSDSTGPDRRLNKNGVVRVG